MSVELSKEIWNEIKRYVTVVDRDEAAETLVSVLVDNDIAADEIKETFKSDSEVKRALAHYLKDLEDDDDEEDFQDDDDGDDEDY
jgi:hypothetical protein